MALSNLSRISILQRHFIVHGTVCCLYRHFVIHEINSGSVILVNIRVLSFCQRKYNNLSLFWQFHLSYTHAQAYICIYRYVCARVCMNVTITIPLVESETSISWLRSIRRLHFAAMVCIEFQAGKWGSYLYSVSCEIYAQIGHWFCFCLVWYAPVHVTIISHYHLAMLMYWMIWFCYCFLSGFKCTFQLYIVYPKKYAHGFVVLCFVVVMQSFIMNSHEVFIHIHQGCFAGTGAIVRLPQCQWSKPDGYGKISQCITTTKHSKAKTVCIFLGIYCSSVFYTSWYGYKCHVTLCIGQQHPITVYRTGFGACVVLLLSVIKGLL